MVNSQGADVNLTVTLDEDGVTINAADIHPIAYSDACQHIGDLVLKLHAALTPAEADGA